MPCYDPRDDEPPPPPRVHGASIEQLAAAVCCLIKNWEAQRLSIDQIRMYDSGLSLGFLKKWWNQHRAEDMRRDLAKQNERQRKLAIARALAKLDDHDLVALKLSRDIEA